MPITVLTVSLERAAYTISEHASATLFVAFEGDLHQESVVPVEISIVDGTTSGECDQKLISQTNEHLTSMHVCFFFFL